MINTYYLEVTEEDFDSLPIGQGMVLKGYFWGTGTQVLNLKTGVDTLKDFVEKYTPDILEEEEFTVFENMKIYKRVFTVLKEKDSNFCIFSCESKSRSKKYESYNTSYDNYYK
jgi:hypothetical protein